MSETAVSRYLGCQITAAIVSLHVRGFVHGHLHARNVRFAALELVEPDSGGTQLEAPPIAGGTVKVSDCWYSSSPTSCCVVRSS